MTTRLLQLLLSMACVLPLWNAHAGFVTQTDTEHVFTLAKRLDEVKRARELSPQETELAERSAAAWFYAGPCKGTRLDIGALSNLMTSISLSRPTRRADAALLEMIAILVTEGSLGREPLPATCRFAEEVAEPYLRPQAK